MSAAAGPISGHHFNPKYDYNHADDAEYKRLRDLANKEYKRKKDLSDKSQQAYQQGDGGEAKQLSNEAKKHADKMDDYNRQAAEFVFRANNADSAEDEIDLHGLYVREAEEFLTKRIQAALQRNETHLDVIVGKGIHSYHGVQKLKPAVEQLCQEHKFKYATEEDNAGVIVIDFTGSGGHVPLNDISHRKKPHKSYHGGYQNNHQNNYHQQQQHHSNNHGGPNTQNLLFKLFCGIIKACLK